MSFTEEKQGQDAPASPETQYRIVPAPDGLFGPGNDTFKGALNSKFDEDWILIRMLHPEEHTITLTGTPGGVVAPSLKL